MSKPLEGKTVVITGTLSMKREDAKEALETLGATVAGTLSAKTHILLAGDKAGSKLDKARALGVEIRDEAWLVALREGVVPSAPETSAETPITGPLSDWVARVHDLARRLAQDPRVRVHFARGEPLGEAALARIEASWKIDALAPAIRNVYRQANGLCLLWIATHHPHYPRVRARWQAGDFTPIGVMDDPVKPSQLPSTHQVEGFASFVWDGPEAPPEGSPPWGAIYLPPLDKALRRAEGILKTDHGGLADDVTRTVAGKTWRGASFERALRVFDYPADACPAAFVMEEGVADPRVVLADDHTDWASGRHASFEAYLEHVLATFGTTRARKDWFAGPPTEAVGAPGASTLDEILPPSLELVPADDGATFAVAVESVETQAGGGPDPRLEAIARVIPGHRYKEVAKVLGLAPFNRMKDVLLPEIAAATADPKKIDAKTAGRLMGAANQPDKSKAAFLEAFAVGLGGGGGGGETLTLRVTTCFDRAGASADDIDGSFTSTAIVTAWLSALGVDPASFVAAKVVEASGRKERTAKVAITLSAPSGVDPARAVRSNARPVGYAQLGDKVVRAVS